MRCASCGSPSGPGARFCAQCGAPLTREPLRANRRPADEDRPAGDRRVVTALFADLVDYVKMLAEHDPEDVRARVTAALGTMGAAIGRFGGTREKFIGDAVFAVFGWPQAHDDDAVRAALAALAIRSGLADIGDGVEPLEVRIGIATGEVVAAGSSPTLTGDLGLTGEAITTAARIQSLARPGEILLDGSTLRAARGRLATEPSRSVVLRGQSTPVELFTLRGEAGMGTWVQHRTAVTGELVGRDAESARISAIIDRCAAAGQGGTLVVIGEAGVGKSRLLAEGASVARGYGMHWTWTENVSYGRGEPYRYARLFAQAMADEHGTDSGSLARRLLFTEDVDEATARRFGGAIAAIARDASFSGWEAEAADMPADPAEVASVIAQVAARYIDRLLETTGPRVIVIDDLHWLDASSVALVEQLIDMTADRPVVVLCGTRPGDLPSWVSRREVERIELTGLDAPNTARLATLVARAAVDAEDAQSLHVRTGGNPLFVGETVRVYLEDGTMERRDGRIALVENAEPQVPVTLRAILGARIDALDPVAREAIGVASVIGIRFRERLLSELLGRPLEPGVLERLAEAALVARGRDGEWRFAHALIHDAAYAGLLASRRRLLHTRLADHLERTRGTRAIEHIAAHRAAAGDRERAVPLLREAAQAAMVLGATLEAAGSWRRAADLAAGDDPEGAAQDLALAAEAEAATRAARRRDRPSA